MKNKVFIIVSSVILTLLQSHFCLATPDETATGFSFVASGLLFKPLIANTFEPRVGFFSELNKNSLRLDICNSIDLLSYRFNDHDEVLSLGADFFTFTQLRGEQNFHFPVNAVDYFFGINVSGKKKLDSGILSARIRISHISAHFVDGHYDGTTARWRDNRYPQVYSREFIDPVICYEPNSYALPFRMYVGGTYVFHIDPRWLSKLSEYAGGEMSFPSSLPLTPYVAYQATFMKIHIASIRHEAQVGVKIGDYRGRGIDIYLSYFSGYSIHGEYFDVKEHYTALGFLIDF